MIIAVDIETQGLDATKYITGCLLKENRKKAKIFRKKEDLWNAVKELGIQEAKRGKVLNVYSHNAQFDTAGYIDLMDKHLVFFCNRPFIWAYRLSSNECDELGIPHDQGKGKEIIKFLDSWAIFKMPLKKLGDIIGIPKIETPKELLEEQTEGNLSEEKLKEIEEYMVRDAEICLKGIQYLKKKIGKEGIKIKRLYTINQIAIGYIMNSLKKLPDKYKEPMFWNKEKAQTRRTFRRDEIHSAYRGGRNEAFKTGVFKEITYVDCNSLYPYSATKMRFPNLKTERKVYKPLEIGYSIKEIVSKIGLSRCLIINKNDKYGLIPIRTPNGSYYPKIGKIMIGTYTHIELEKALKNGYEIKEIEWSVTFEETENPFKGIFERLYKLRKSGSELDNYFYKMMMNAGIGKMAQHRTNQEMFIDNVEKCEEYLEKNFKVIKGIGTNYMYKKTEVQGTVKPYYMPIVPCLINAYARCYMYDFFKKIPINDLVYTDTDSCLFLNNHLDKFPIGKNMGEFDIEHKKEKCIIYGRKTYSIGEQVKIAGINRRGIEIEDFEKGYVESTRMKTINTTNDVKEVGKFVKEKRDLNIQEDNHKEIQNRLNEQKLLVDNDIEDIGEFVIHL